MFDARFFRAFPIFPSVTPMPLFFSSISISAWRIARLIFFISSSLFLISFIRRWISPLSVCVSPFVLVSSASSTAASFSRFAICSSNLERRSIGVSADAPKKKRPTKKTVIHTTTTIRHVCFVYIMPVFLAFAILRGAVP